MVDRASGCVEPVVARAAPLAPAATPALDASSAGETGSVTTQCAKTHMAAGSRPTRRHGVGLVASLTASHGESQPRTTRSADTQRTSSVHCNVRESTRPPATYTLPFSTAQPKKFLPTLNLLRRIQRICTV